MIATKVAVCQRSAMGRRVGLPRRQTNSMFGRRGDGTASALDDRLRGRRPMVRVVSLALMTLGCLTVPVRSQPRDESADPPKGLRVFFASHSGMGFVPDPLGELAEAARIKDHKMVGLQKP